MRRLVLVLVVTLCVAALAALVPILRAAMSGSAPPAAAQGVRAPESAAAVQHPAIALCLDEMAASWAGFARRAGVGPMPMSDDLRESLGRQLDRCLQSSPTVPGLQIFVVQAGSRIHYVLHGPATEADLGMSQADDARWLARDDGPWRAASGGAWQERVRRLSGVPERVVVARVLDRRPSPGPTEPRVAADPGMAPGWAVAQAVLSLAALLLVLTLLWLVRRVRRVEAAYRRELQVEADRRRTKEAELEAEVLRHQATADELRRQITARLDVEDGVRFGLLGLGPDAGIAHVNRAFALLTGWSQERLKGLRPPYPFWPQEELSSADDLMRLAADALAREEDGLWVGTLRSDGVTLRLKVTARRLASVEGWLLTCSDVSREAENLRRVEANSEQDALLAMGVSAGELLHKLANRNGAYTQALVAARHGLQNQRLDLVQQGLDIAQRAGSQLNTLVEEFRPLLRNELELKPVSLHELVTDALANVRPRAMAANVLLLNAVSPELPSARLNRVMVHHTLINLIDNAIAALEDSPIANRQITVESWVSPQQGQIQILVRDRGPGVAPELREAIFRHGHSTRKAHGGHGIGLHNCRRWIEMLGGSLTVGDNPPQGAVFTLVLPLPP